VLVIELPRASILAVTSAERVNVIELEKEDLPVGPRQLEAGRLTLGTNALDLDVE